ncbi:c-type cytochrome biogenesis protein CcmI [Vibrio mimicus]|uniref:C-type cytochrome biogenesis protein CcmI n=1 Tax=Vibrio mimicus TaxID=674 RepID=A0A2J9UXL6_VIBMI|nr:c-type cytochrome biogenesis protein CcmI [Vibrio mimicus]EEW11286.1 cytochrome c-type biogenesis protein ccmH precursor [Vibrio mimicus VM573]EGU21003.1 cytoChrome c-type biogenesis protein CcmH [Vibrio mimicus SX-4]EMB50984.1 cytochrome c-type biogenesis protein CcmH [Vibrio mimicus CAIM 602]KFE32557.1 cytochrome c-type biogenesis protein CcmI [Vibrio mimicus]MBY7674303.1 c-type cytochrome biogenesis protein CcmI [Vibrio mimicus]
MWMFWISTLLLVAIAVVFVIIPFIQKRANNDQELRDELNKAFYKDRLKELEEETEEGIVVDQQDLIADLKQTLLDDIPTQQKHQQENKVSLWMVVVPSVLLVVGLSYALYAKFGNYQHVQAWQQVSAQLPELSKKLMSPQAELSDEEMNDLTLALRTRLHYQADDVTGWLLLGRIGLANRDLETAIGAMKKAFALDSEDPDVKFGYAQALMLSNEPVDQQEAKSILLKLAQRGYADLRVYSLLAFDAFESGDFPAAIKYWSLMQQAIGPEDARYEMLSRSIESARKRMGEGIADGKSVKVTINVAEQVKIDPNAVLIVSVHAPGSPMPVAAARYPIGEFPRTVVLDDNNSMMQGSKLSSLESYVVRVRIDTDGNVATKTGDWYAESPTMKAGEPVDVVLDKQYE